jgi:hypothetical protein
MTVMTLRALVEAHPEWLDLELGILCSDGTVDFVGAAGSVYVAPYNEDESVSLDAEPRHPDTVDIVLFAPN